MQIELFNHIADVIQRDNGQIRVINTSEWIEVYSIVDGQLKKDVSRALTVCADIKKGSSVQHKTWKIPEKDLLYGCICLKKVDPTSLQRFAALQLNIEDVEYIIHKATYDYLKLALKKYER